jgi:7-cyano-7-deazaguanine synthase
MKGVVVMSGGLDSTTLLYRVLEGFEVVQAVSFNYGQRHKKELEFAQATCEKLHVPWTTIDLWSSGLTELLSESNSSLVSDEEVPEGHYAEENMKATVVPNRNMIMLSIAGGIAVAKKANLIFVGVHAGDHFIYPDCRPEFVNAAGDAIYLGNEGFGELIPGPIVAPYMQQSKADIAFDAISLGVPFEETWSCYKGGAIHCGRCGTCVERMEAIATATKRWYAMTGEVVADQTPYQDTEFWREALKRSTV